MITRARYKHQYRRIALGLIDALFEIQVNDGPWEDRWYRAAGTSLEACRESVTAEIRSLNGTESQAAAFEALLASNPDLGEIEIEPPAPVEVPPTARELWWAKVDLLARARTAGVTAENTLTTALSTLEADIVSTFEASFLDAL